MVGFLRRPWRSRVFIGSVCAAAGAALAGGLAYATIPDSSGIIYGCYGNKTGALRVIDSSSSCTSKETPISWNQQGTSGPSGPTGASGPAGELGATGPAG